MHARLKTELLLAANDSGSLLGHGDYRSHSLKSTRCISQGAKNSGIRQPISKGVKNNRKSAARNVIHSESKASNDEEL